MNTRMLLFFRRATAILALASLASAQEARDQLVSLDVREADFREVVEKLRRQLKVNLVLEAGVEEKVTLSFVDVPWRAALDLVAERAGCVVVPLAPNLFKLHKPPRVHFGFEDADVRKVIEGIAKVSGANIVVSPEVKGIVSFRMQDVPWRDALEAISRTMGLVVVEESRGILRVVPAASLEAQLQTRAFQLRWIRPPSTYTPKIDSEFVLSPFTGRQGLQQGGIGALGAQTASERVKKEFSLLQALEKALSPKGRLDYIDRQNLLVVRDISTVLEEIAAILEAMDVEPKQVMVDVKFIAVADTDLLDFGVNYGDAGASIRLQGGQIPLDQPFRVDNLDARGSLPSAAPNLVAPDVIFGTLDFTQLQATLTLLRRDKRNEVVQAPQIIAVDHQPATIFVGEEIRFAIVRTEQGQAGGALQAIEEAPDSPIKVGFQLLVIPHVVPETNMILMDIIPKQDALSGTGGPPLAPPGFDVFTIGTGGPNAPPGTIALPRVSSSTIATTMKLKSGQTAVLGGLRADTDQETVSKIPILGDIPLLGALFRHTQRTKERRDFLVFVTPTILRSDEQADEWLRRELERRHERMRREYDRARGGASEAGGTGGATGGESAFSRPDR